MGDEKTNEIRAASDTPRIPFRRMNRRTDVINLVLSFLFFLCAVAFVIFHRHVDTEFTWVVFIVAFSFALVGSLVLFYFLSSIATIQHSTYKVGGAAAGFVLLFQLFLHVTEVPAANENQLFRLANSDLINELVPIADSFSKIRSEDSDKLLNIAVQQLEKLRKDFDRLSHGTYVVDATELPIQLMPMIDNARSTYLATQYVLPETFWSQYWSEEYFQKNVDAAKRCVRLLRVFILDSKEAEKQKDILDALIRRHVENGIDIRLLDAASYVGSPDDLRDILLVDNTLTGIILLNREGKFQNVEFSIDRGVVQDHAMIFQRLLAQAVNYDVWKAKFYPAWHSN